MAHQRAGRRREGRLALLPSRLGRCSRDLRSLSRGKALRSRGSALAARLRCADYRRSRVDRRCIANGFCDDQTSELAGIAGTGLRRHPPRLPRSAVPLKIKLRHYRRAPSEPTAMSAGRCARTSRRRSHAVRRQPTRCRLLAVAATVVSSLRPRKRQLVLSTGSQQTVMFHDVPSSTGARC